MSSSFLLRDGFALGQFSPEGGLFYKDNPEQRAGRVIFQNQATDCGRPVLTLVVTPSSGAMPDGWSERAEVWEKSDVLAPYDEVVWYGFSMRLNDPVPQDDGRYVLAQWKREISPGTLGDYSPFLAIRLYQGKLAITVETDLVQSFTIGGPERPNGCLPGEARVWSRPSSRQTRTLVATEGRASLYAIPTYFDACASCIKVLQYAELPSAHKCWVDFIVRSNPGPSGDGHIEVWANGDRIASVTGNIGHQAPGLGKRQYFKFGPYRAPRPEVWSVSYADFRRGPRYEDVALRS